MLAGLGAGPLGTALGQGPIETGTIPSLTPPADDGDSVRIRSRLVSQFGPVVPGQRFLLALELEIAPNYHLYANPKQGEFGLDTEVIIPASRYFRFGRVAYPAGREYIDEKNDGARNHIYEGRTVIYIPVQAVASVGVDLPGREELTFRLRGLTCSQGSCELWRDQVVLALDLAPAGTASTPREPELFAGLDLSGFDWNPVTDGTGGDSTAAQPPPESSVPAGPDGTASLEIPAYRPREFQGTGLGADDWLTPILLALAAGVLLNLMPCVLPVIPLKILSLIQQSQADTGGDRFKAIKLSLVFSAGILLVFVGLAVVMGVFKILYGQQFQSVAFKLVMLAIVYVLALSMLGLFEVVLPGRLTNIQVVRKGYVGALGMGILATLLATPCSAPLLGPVLAWSLAKPLAVTVGVFIMVGVGMAAPYVVLTAFPRLLRRLPKAGAWMVRLKQALGFVMLAVAAYLIFLFEPGWHVPLVMFCVVLALALWLGMQVVNFAAPAGRRRLARAAALLLVGLGGLYLYASVRTTPAADKEKFSLADLLAAHERGQGVFVEFTADWCPNCKYVEKTVLNRAAFRERLAATNTRLLIADWTRFDPDITRLLNELGSKSIPFAAVFPGGIDYLEPIVLRDIYTLDTALQALDRTRPKADAARSGS
ncbi:MAG: thioredoxin family protein [Sedimentisphaerales bacterium]|nr:thioredoxin family protein [Sedimentisphaerales bacterium]